MRSAYRSPKLRLALAAAILTSACAVETGDGIDLSSEQAGSGEQAVGQDVAWCPGGSEYDAQYRMCTTSTEALGPFTEAMIEACKASGGGDDACEEDWWSAHFARAIRGTGRCPPGASLEEDKGYCVEAGNVFGPFSFALVDRCRRQGGGLVCETARWSKEMVPDRPDVWCPPGKDYDFDHRLCVSEREAAGPFTKAMIEICMESAGGQETCNADLWDLSLAQSIRGTGKCPPGASLDTGKGYCREGDQLFGPFSPALVERCRSEGGGPACETMRWTASLVPDAEPALVFPIPLDRPGLELSLFDSPSSTAAFGAGRSGGRVHAGCDLYFTNDGGGVYHGGYHAYNEGTPIYAVKSGVIKAYYAFYQGTSALEVDHGDFVIRYGEVDDGGLPGGLRVGSKVSAGQHIAWMGDLAMSSGSWSMLHFEIFSGKAGGSLTNAGNWHYDHVPDRNYQRRRDLMDCRPFLRSILDQ